MVIMENGSNIKRSGGTPGERGEAETGTALDYLWLAQQAMTGPQGGALAPVEAAGVSLPLGDSLLDGEAAQGTDKLCLDATLKSYSSWLKSIQCD